MNSMLKAKILEEMTVNIETSFIREIFDALPSEMQTDPNRKIIIEKIMKYQKEGYKLWRRKNLIANHARQRQLRLTQKSMKSKNALTAV